jgi:TetR/AcrR family acrAB operon transcriptional repressor
MVRKTKEDAEKTRKEIIEAARTVFHRCGVSRSTLEKIAQSAGVTRGAVYWHFKDKAELFFAMREDVFTPMVARTDSFLLSEEYANPLDAIEASLQEFFRVLEDCSVVREVFEIMISRCEYVDEFASVQEEIEAALPSGKNRAGHQNAADKYVAPGWIRRLARDTCLTSGLLHLLPSCQKGDAPLSGRFPR